MNSYRLATLSPNATKEHLTLSPVLPETIARTVADTGQPAVLIRRQLPYVLLGPKDRRLPRLNDAVQWLNDLGYPTYMRIGGGSAVVLDEECLSFAVAQPSRDFTTWESNFRSMGQGVIDGLAHLGIITHFGSAPGSYCEGPYDLLYGPQKVAGIAQAIRGGFALVSGMLLVRQDPARTTAILQEFYHRAGSSIQLRAEAVTALHRLPGQSRLTVHDVEEALVAGFADNYPLQAKQITAEEWNLSRDLLESRRIHPIHQSHKEDESYASRHTHG